ncbi:MAG: hypothetical protein ACTSPV_08745, partial [Candidatus Hodarchaeales archaeon]
MRAEFFFELIFLFVIITTPLNNIQKYPALESDAYFDIGEFFPQSSEESSNVLSRPLQIQKNVMAWLEQNINLSELLDSDFEKGIVQICEATISVSSAASVSIFSDFSLQIYEFFDLLINGILQTDSYSLNKSNAGLYYIWDGVSGYVSTKLNLYIAQTLKYVDFERIPNKVDIIYNIIIALNATVQDVGFPLLLRDSVFLDINEDVVPASLSQLANLEDQLRFLDIIQFLISTINENEKVQNLIIEMQVLEENILNDVNGFLDYSIPISGLELGFFHSTIDQVEGNTYFNNKSYYSFKNAYFLLDYFVKQSSDFSEKDSDSAFDFYDPSKAEEYQVLLLALLTDIQYIFKDEETGLFYSTLSYSNDTELVEFSDKLYISDQFTLINILSEASQSFTEMKGLIEYSVSPDQMQELYIDLWKSLEGAYVEVMVEGTGSAVSTSVTGFFYGFYSKNLGLFLYDNSTYGSLLLANLLALAGLGTIFPFQLTVNYLDPLTTRDQQSLNITISPTSIKNGFLMLSDIYLKVTQENIDSLISQVTLTAQYNTSIHYNYSVLTEGTIQFSLQLKAKQAVFFTLDSSYSVLKTLSIEAKLNPTSPVQKEQLTVVIEARDQVGIVRDGVIYNAKIQSSTLTSPIWIVNRSLYSSNGSENPIILNTTQTNSKDLVLYIIATKTNYYPAELNMTIHFQTKLNFLFEWLTWFVFESDFGGYIG